MSALTQGKFLAPTPPCAAWGQQRIHTVPAPGAGKEWSFTAQPSMLTRVVSAFVVLTASAQVGKRIPSLEVRDGDGNTLLCLNSFQEVEKSTIHKVTAARDWGGGVNNAAGPVMIEVPPLLLEPGYQIGSFTEGIQTEDTYGEVRLWVEEYEQNPDHPMAELAAEVAQILHLREAATYAAS